MWRVPVTSLISMLPLGICRSSACPYTLRVSLSNAQLAGDVRHAGVHVGIVPQRQEHPCICSQAEGAEEGSDEEEAPHKGGAKAGKRPAARKRGGKAGKRGRNIFIDDAAEEDDDVSCLSSWCAVGKRLPGNLLRAVWHIHSMRIKHATI